MKPVKLFARRPAAIVMALLAAASLAACGGGSRTPNPDPGTPTVDAFVTAVSAIVANSPEDAEADSGDANVATAPEASEPQPIG